MAGSRVFLGTQLGGAAAAPDPFRPTQLPDPVRRKQVGEFTVSAGLLLTTLAVVVPAPFFGSAQELPVRKPYTDLTHLVTNLHGAVLETQDLPRAPVVTAPIPQRVAQVTHSLNLLGTTLRDAPPPPDSSVVFRPPTFAPGRILKGAQHNDFQNLLTGTLASTGEPAASPFIPAGFVDPLRRVATAQETPQSRLALTFVQPPFVAPGLPQPAGRSAAQQGGTAGSWRWLIEPPLRPTETAQRVRARAPQHPEQGQGLALTQQPQAVPFRTADTAQPVARRAAQPQQDANRLPLVSFVPIGTPFAQYEWSTPPRLRYSAALHATPQNLLALGIPDAPVVAAADEWIIRARRRGRR